MVAASRASSIVTCVEAENEDKKKRRSSFGVRSAPFRSDLLACSIITLCAHICFLYIYISPYTYICMYVYGLSIISDYEIRFSRARLPHGDSLLNLNRIPKLQSPGNICIFQDSSSLSSARRGETRPVQKCEPLPGTRAIIIIIRQEGKALPPARNLHPSQR